MIVTRKLSGDIVATFDTHGGEMKITYIGTGLGVTLTPEEQIEFITMLEEIIEQDYPLTKKT